VPDHQLDFPLKLDFPLTLIVNSIPD